MQLELICAKKTDIKMLNALMRQSKAHWGYDSEFMDKFMDLFQITRSYFERSITKLLYMKPPKEEKILIGFYGLAANTDNELELDHFFIHPRFIGQGFGRKLWDQLTETIKHLGKNEFTLWSDPGAEAFYSKMGCEKIGTRESPMAKGRSPAIFKYTIVRNHHVI